MKLDSIYYNMHHLDLYREMLCKTENVTDIIGLMEFRELASIFERQVDKACMEGIISVPIAYSYIVEAEQMNMKTYNKIRTQLWN